MHTLSLTEIINNLSGIIEIQSDIIGELSQEIANIYAEIDNIKNGYDEHGKKEVK